MSGPVEEYEVLYRETGNALFVWEALECCQRDEPLPGWIRDYLSGAARALIALDKPSWDEVLPIDPDDLTSRPMGLLDLADAVCREEIDATEAARRATRAFGLVADLCDPGDPYNAFSQLKQLRREFGEALYLDTARDGSEMEARLEKIKQSYVGQTGGTAGQIARRVKRARRLWDTQRKTDA
jgi:hypothetical protein